MFDIPLYLLGFAKSLLGIRGDLNKAALEKRQRVADYLDKIALCLEKTIEDINQRTTDGVDEGAIHAIHWKIKSNCGELEEYLFGLEKALEGVVEDEKIRECLNLLGHSHVRRFMADAIATQGESPKAQLEVLGDATGRFRAFANSLRV